MATQDQIVIKSEFSGHLNLKNDIYIVLIGIFKLKAPSLTQLPQFTTWGHIVIKYEFRDHLIQ